LEEEACTAGKMHRRIQLVVFDESGRVAAGASGAAAGLLHPFAPSKRRKRRAVSAGIPRMLFRGRECVEAARRNLKRAESAYRRRGMVAEAESVADYMSGILKMEGSACDDDGARVEVRSLHMEEGSDDVSASEGCVPPVARRLVDASEEGKHPSTVSGESTRIGSATFMSSGVGVTVDTVRYLEGLWLDVLDTVSTINREMGFADAALACTAELRQQSVHCIARLGGPEGTDVAFDDVICCCGAGIGSLCVTRESEIETGGVFQRIASAMSTCVGHVVSARAQDDRGCLSGDAGASNAPRWRGPSVYTVRGEYLATHEGGREVTAGATKIWKQFVRGQPSRQTGSRWRSYEDFMEDNRVLQDEKAQVASMWSRSKQFLDAGARASQVSAGDGGDAYFHADNVKSGVRLCPPRHPVHNTTVPVVGRIRLATPGDAEGDTPRLWCLLGLGFRGVVYHALFGQLLAARVAAANGSNADSILDPAGASDFDIDASQSGNGISDIRHLVDCALDVDTSRD